MDPCSLEVDVVAGNVSGLTKVLPVGPTCTASCVALPRSNCYQVKNHWV